VDSFRSRKNVFLKRENHIWQREHPFIFSYLYGKRAAGSPSDPDYATYGNSRITYHVDGRNWENTTESTFPSILIATAPRVVNMNLTFTNDSSTPKQGYNLPSGSHLINLVNKQWNHCFLEIDEYQRDKGNIHQLRHRTERERPDNRRLCHLLCGRYPVAANQKIRKK
jgi:hypothetical protein